MHFFFSLWWLVIVEMLCCWQNWGNVLLSEPSWQKHQHHRVFTTKTSRLLVLKVWLAPRRSATVFSAMKCCFWCQSQPPWLLLPQHNTCAPPPPPPQLSVQLIHWHTFQPFTSLGDSLFAPVSPTHPVTRSSLSFLSAPVLLRFSPGQTAFQPRSSVPEASAADQSTLIETRRTEEPREPTHDI